MNGVFWSLRNLLELILFLCCCPCVCAVALRALRMNPCVVDALDDCQDAVTQNAGENCAAILVRVFQSSLRSSCSFASSPGTAVVASDCLPFVESVAAGDSPSGTGWSDVPGVPGWLPSGKNDNLAPPVITAVGVLFGVGAGSCGYVYA